MVKNLVKLSPIYRVYSFDKLVAVSQIPFPLYIYSIVCGYLGGSAYNTVYDYSMGDGIDTGDSVEVI